MVQAHQQSEKPCFCRLQIDKLNDKFVEARDEIEFAEEDAETTYFNESHKLAKDSVSEVLALYQEIQTELTEEDKGKLQRSMGMKMEQLKVRLGHCPNMSFTQHVKQL